MDTPNHIWLGLRPYLLAQLRSNLGQRLSGGWSACILQYLSAKTPSPIRATTPCRQADKRFSHGLELQASLHLTANLSIKPPISKTLSIHSNPGLSKSLVAVRCTSSLRGQLLLAIAYPEIFGSQGQDFEWLDGFRNLHNYQSGFPIHITVLQ